MVNVSFFLFLHHGIYTKKKEKNCCIATVNESIKKDLLEHIKKFLDDNLE